MLMSMLTITLLKTGCSNLDHYLGLFQFFRGVNLKLIIWGKLQRSPSPLPTYLESKRLVNLILTSAGPCVASEVHAA